MIESEGPRLLFASSTSPFDRLAPPPRGVPSSASPFPLRFEARRRGLTSDLGPGFFSVFRRRESRPESLSFPFSFPPRKKKAAFEAVSPLHPRYEPANLSPGCFPFFLSLLPSLRGLGEPAMAFSIRRFDAASSLDPLASSFFLTLGRPFVAAAHAPSPPFSPCPWIDAMGSSLFFPLPPPRALPARRFFSVCARAANLYGRLRPLLLPPPFSSGASTAICKSFNYRVDQVLPPPLSSLLG